MPIPQKLWIRALLVVAMLAVSLVLVWWQGPDWDALVNAFTIVHWWWIVAALALNFASTVARALAWRTVVNQALPPPHPPFPRLFSAFAVGLLANAVLPGRIGELARVAVLTRGQPRGRGDTANLVGTVFAHRLFDLFPALILLVYVLLTARIPDWAMLSLVLVTAIGVALFALAVVSARLDLRPTQEIVGPARRVLRFARRGLSVLNAPAAAALAALFQCLGVLLQLFAVYLTMRAFGIHAPLPAAALVLLLMNVATIFPLWPGNIGLLQAAVALPLVSYGVAYARGFAYGLGLQMIDMSVGVGIGLVFLAREGLSFASLKRLPSPADAELSEDTEAVALDAEGARARVPG